MKLPWTKTGSGRVNRTWKYPLGKGETSTNHRFLGSMFVLEGVCLLLSGRNVVIVCFFLWRDSKRRDFAPDFFFTYISGLNLYGKDEQKSSKGCLILSHRDRNGA